MVLLGLALYLVVWLLAGAVGGAMRVRDSLSARERYGMFLVQAISGYIGIIIVFVGLGLVFVNDSRLGMLVLCLQICALVLSGPFMCGLLIVKAGKFLNDPDRSICDACGYDMRGSPSRVCPECGREQSHNSDGPRQ